MNSLLIGMHIDIYKGKLKSFKLPLARKVSILFEILLIYLCQSSAVFACAA